MEQTERARTRLVVAGCWWVVLLVVGGWWRVNKKRKAGKAVSDRHPPSANHTTIQLPPSTNHSVRSGRDSNPRYRYKPVCRFSKPVPSASRPPLLSTTEGGR